MNAKKVSVSIFVIIFILFAVVSLIVYDVSDSVKIICFEDSYAEEYAEKHDIDYDLISDSDTYIGILNLEHFDYNYTDGKGEIVSYSGDSEKIAIPEDIEGRTITKVSENAFENAKNLKTVYLPKSIDAFEPKKLEGVTVHLYKDTELYKTLSNDDSINFEIETIPDSYYVDFYSANIPFSYDEISDKSIEINRYYAHLKAIVIPETIDGKLVTSISFDALEDGVETILIPQSVISINNDLYRSRYDWDFLIGLLMAFVGVLIAAILALTLKVPQKENLFLRISQFKTAYTLTVLSVLLGSVYLFVNIISDWIIFLLFALVCGISLLSIIKAKTAVTLVEGIDEKVKVQTQFIKLLAADAEHLMVSSKTAELRTEAQKVYEAIRYSDPMSNDALSDIEEQIQSEFTFFTQAIKSEDLELAKSVADGLINLIDGRNKKCKVLK